MELYYIETQIFSLLLVIQFSERFRYKHLFIYLKFTIRFKVNVGKQLNASPELLNKTAILLTVGQIETDVVKWC